MRVGSLTALGGVVLIAVAGAWAYNPGESMMVSGPPSTERSRVAAFGGAPASAPRIHDLRPVLPGKVIDVTVMRIAFAAIDANGRMVSDLQPEELQVFEDGAPVVLLELDQRTRVAAGAARQGAMGEASGGGVRGWQQRVVVYVSAELGGRPLMRTLCRRVSEELARLTILGPVDVVVAAPTPRVVTAAEHRPEEVRRALDSAVSESAGATEVMKNRKLFARAFRQKMGLESNLGVARASPAVAVVRTREAMRRERSLLRGEIERMVEWLQSQPPTAAGLMMWMTGGFDLNPADFYIPLVEQIDPVAGRTLRSDYPDQSLEHEVRYLADVAVSQGWTVLPVTSPATRFLFGMDCDALETANRAPGAGAIRLAGQAVDLSQADPARPLQIVAQTTGGLVAANAPELSHAIDRAEALYRLAYQVNRPPDGAIHRIEVHSFRPGVRILCGGHAASGTSRGLAAGRGLHLLAGGEVHGTLDLSAGIHNIGKADKGRHIGDLDVRADLGGLRGLLSPLQLGRMRVTVVVEIDDGSPFVEHQEIDLHWDRMRDLWRFTAGIKWPKKARRMAVVVEELVSSTWGSVIVDLN